MNLHLTEIEGADKALTKAIEKVFMRGISLIDCLPDDTYMARSSIKNTPWEKVSKPTIFAHSWLINPWILIPFPVLSIINPIIGLIGSGALILGLYIRHYRQSSLVLRSKKTKAKLDIFNDALADMIELAIERKEALKSKGKNGFFWNSIIDQPLETIGKKIAKKQLPVVRIAQYLNDLYLTLHAIDTRFNPGILYYQTTYAPSKPMQAKTTKKDSVEVLEMPPAESLSKESQDHSNDFSKALEETLLVSSVAIAAGTVMTVSETPAVDKEPAQSEDNISKETESLEESHIEDKPEEEIKEGIEDIPAEEAMTDEVTLSEEEDIELIDNDETSIDYDESDIFDQDNPDDDYNYDLIDDEDIE